MHNQRLPAEEWPPVASRNSYSYPKYTGSQRKITGKPGVVQVVLHLQKTVCTQCATAAVNRKLIQCCIPSAISPRGALSTAYIRICCAMSALSGAESGVKRRHRLALAGHCRVASVEHLRHGLLLPDASASNIPLRLPRDFQHGSGSYVYVPIVPCYSSTPTDQNLHGRQRAGPGQCHHRTILAKLDTGGDRNESNRLELTANDQRPSYPK